MVPGNDFFDHLGEYLDLEGDSPICIIISGFTTDAGIAKDSVPLEWGETYHINIPMQYLIKTRFHLNFIQIGEMKPYTG